MSVTISGTTGIKSPGYLLTSSEVSSTSYSLQLTDSSKMLFLTGASAITITIPPQSSVGWVADTQIMFVRYSSSSVTFQAGSGVTIRSADSLLSVASQYASVMLYRKSQDEWLLTGALV